MKRKHIIVIVGLLAGLLISPALAPGDIHRPPRPPAGEKSAETDEARRLWEEGQAYEKEGDYDEAIDSYEDLIDDYPDSRLAPEALFRMGGCLEKEDELYEAFETYQRLLNEYPGRGELGEILARQFRIGEAYLRGRRRTFLFFRIGSGLDTAVEIFRAVVENATFSDYAPRAQYNLGLALQKQGEYEEADLEYDVILKTYPNSEVIGPAVFQKGMCAYQEALKADYDQKKVDAAIKWFELLIKRFPTDPNRQQAEVKLGELLDRKAEKDFLIGRFYESKDAPRAARIYYKRILEKHPESRWAALARKRLSGLPPDEDRGEQGEDS